jgi:uncharacterized Rossmann fold enzyme
MKNLLYTSIVAMLLGACAVADEKVATVAVGKTAPDITMTGIDGKEMKLSDVTSRGKNVALMFSRAHW